MWTLFTSLMGRLSPHTLAVVVLLSTVVLTTGLYVLGLKKDLATSTSALAAAESNLSVCNVAVAQYQSATIKLQQEHEQALKKAAQVSVKTKAAVAKVRAQPVDNTMDAIKQQGLSTAPLAVQLWDE